MLQYYQQKLDLFIRNHELIKSYMPLRVGISKNLSAFLFAAQGASLDSSKLEELRLQMKERPGRGKTFARVADLPVWTELLLSGRPLELCVLAEQAFELLRKYKLGRSRVSAYLAVQMAQKLEPEKFADFAEQLLVVRSGFKRSFRSGALEQQILLAGGLLLAGADARGLAARYQQISGQMKETLVLRLRSEQAALVLALADNPSAQLARYCTLAAHFKQERYRISERYVLSSLALLSFLPLTPQDVVAAIKTISAYLHKQRDLAALYAPQYTVSILSAALLTFYYWDGQAAPLAGDAMSKPEQGAVALGREQAKTLLCCVLAAADDQIYRAEASE